MADFMLIIKGGATIGSNGLPSVQMEQQMSGWANWLADLERREILRGGKPLDPDVRHLDSTGAITNGSAVKSGEAIAGYIVLDVENIDAAAREARACPALKTGAEIEIRPINQSLPSIIDKILMLRSVPMN